MGGGTLQSGGDNNSFELYLLHFQGGGTLQSGGDNNIIFNFKISFFGGGTLQNGGNINTGVRLASTKRGG